MSPRIYNDPRWLAAREYQQRLIAEAEADRIPAAVRRRRQRRLRLNQTSATAPPHGEAA
jgi:hypothetical protein